MNEDEKLLDEKLRTILHRNSSEPDGIVARGKDYRNLLRDLRKLVFTQIKTHDND